MVQDLNRLRGDKSHSLEHSVCTILGDPGAVSRVQLSPRTFYRTDSLPLGLRGWGSQCPWTLGLKELSSPQREKQWLGAQSYRVECLRLHWTESMTPKSFFSSIIENPWAKSKRHIFKPGLHIFSETNKLQQALVNFPWSNHPKERINTDKHPLSVSHEHPCKYITCSYAVKDDWMMLTLG